MWSVPNPEKDRKAAEEKKKESARFRHFGNKELHKAMMGIRSSSKAGPMASKANKRARTRLAQIQRSMKDFEG